MNLTKEILAGFTDQDKELTMSDFEILLCMIFGELYRGLQAFLKGEDQWQSQGFQLAMQRVQHILRLLYHDFMI